MWKVRFLAVSVALILLLLGTVAVRAQDDFEQSVYVRTDYVGNEKGTTSEPYDTKDEGVAYAQSLPGGADLYVWNGISYVRVEYVPSAYPGDGGVPLAEPLFWVLLFLLAVLLLGSGVILRRRFSPQQQRSHL